MVWILVFLLETIIVIIVTRDFPAGPIRIGTCSFLVMRKPRELSQVLNQLQMYQIRFREIIHRTPTLRKEVVMGVAFEITTLYTIHKFDLTGKVTSTIVQKRLYNWNIKILTRLVHQLSHLFNFRIRTKMPLSRMWHGVWSKCSPQTSSSWSA